MATTKYITIPGIGKAFITAKALSPDGLGITQTQIIEALNVVGQPPRRPIIESPTPPFSEPAPSISPPPIITTEQIIPVVTEQPVLQEAQNTTSTTSGGGASTSEVSFI